MGISRRSALKVMAAAAATMVGTTLSAHETQAAAVVARPDAVGMLYDATRCIGCKACMVACNEANDVTPDTSASGGLWDMPRRPQRARQEHHQALPRLGHGRTIIRQTAVHALPRSGVRRRLHAGCYAERREGHRVLQSGSLRRLPILRDGLPVQRPQVRMVQGHPEGGQVRTVPTAHRQRPGTRRAARCALSAQSSTGSAPISLLMRINGSRRIPAATCRKCTASTKRAVRRCCIWRTSSSRSSACRRTATSRCRGECERIQDTIYKGFVAPVALYGLLAAVMLRNREKPDSAKTEEGQR